MCTFFSKKSKGLELTRGNTCYQLFVTGYLCSVPIQKKINVLLAIKILSKDVGIPEAIVIDDIIEKKHIDLRRIVMSR